METPAASYKEGSVAAKAGAATVVYLGGGLLLAFGVAIAASNVPLHIGEIVKNTFAALVLLAILMLASLQWGRKMAEISGLGDRPRAARIGGLSYAVTLFVAALILPAGEMLLGRGIPTHVIYAALFVPAAFLIVASTAMAWGRSLGDWNLARSLALRAALPAALAFLLVYLMMDALSYRVGAPGAGERATMITVTFVGCIGAAAAGGAALGSGLRRYSLDG